MKKSFYAIALTFLVVSFSSCTKNLDDVLIGTWIVAEIKTEPETGSTTTVSDAGTITFLSDGSGSYSIDYGLGEDTGNFTWSAADNNETVAISGGLFDIVTGQYTVLTNKKNQQVWQQINADGDKRTYTLEK